MVNKQMKRVAEHSHFGRSPGFARMGIFAVALAALPVACSSNSDEGPLNLQGDGGASALDPARVLRGEVTVLGQTSAAAVDPRTFSGPPNSAVAGSELVRCSFAVNGSRSKSGALLPPNLSVVASLAGQTQSLAMATISGIEKFRAFSGQLTYEEGGQNALSLVVRLGPGGASSFDEYWYAADSAVTPSALSTCSIDVPTFTAERAVGQIACESLFATSASRNASPSGTLQPTASATIAFDCPVQVVDVDGKVISAGSGGAGGAGGRGGAGQGGSANGGSNGGRAGGPTSVGGSGGGSTNTVNILGTACESDGDCSGPLSCHHSTDYIADRQCASSCDSNEQCTAKFGADSMCIGAHICVRTCTASTVCPAKSRCNDNGWCERSGPGSGVPYCSGFPTPCSLLSSLQCIGAYGCKDDSHCAGVASSCYSQFDSYSCSSQDGCYWSTSSKSCSGSARSCSSMLGSGTCALQDGCYWTGGCTGTPEACEEQYQTLCTNQPGCTLRTD